MKNAKTLALALAVTLLMAGCGQTTPVSSAPEAPASSASVSSQSQNEENPKNMDLLTGLGTLTDGAVGKRPVAVMVNNLVDSLPQYGVSDADVIFEIPVEDNITRLMAMYGDYTKVPKICSLRSCRYYYPILAVGFDAFYVHWGQDPGMAQQVLNTLDIDDLNGTENTYGLYGRDQARLNSGMSLEHTGYFDGTGLAAALKQNGVRTDLKSEKTGAAFSFQSGTNLIKPDGNACTKMNVQFGQGDYFSTFTYDSKTGTYLKQHNGKPHVDGVTGAQLSFTNVIVLETDISQMDSTGHKSVNWKGGKGTYKGYYLSDGMVQSITWEKTGEYDYLKFYDNSGKELKINRGKTYIALNYPGYVTCS